MTSSPKFIDLMPNSPNGPTGWVYECTNEDLPTLRSLTSTAVRGGWFLRRVKKVGSIASGGEVPLTVLLPAVKGELIAVDHSLGSLAWAFFKVHLLQRFPTTTEFKKWLKDVDEAEFTKVFKEVIATLPFSAPNYLVGWGMSSNLEHIRNQWLSTPAALLSKARERLDLITFIHGDITDIAPYGPFDLLYVSNALAHVTSKTNQEHTGDAIKPLLTARGKVIATHDLTPVLGPPQANKLTTWDSIKYVRVTNPTTRWGNITWNYNLYQKPSAQAPSKTG